MTTLRTIEYEGVRAPLLRPQFAQRMAAERERDWAAVCLVDLEFEAGKPFIPAGYRRARATIHLGRLTPADVRAHLVTARAVADDVTARHDPRVRLTVGYAYGNGVYVFEGHVAEEALDAPERLRVLVEPGFDAREPMALATPAGRRKVFGVMDAKV